jgi:two-component system sensor histidine kinase FlrB
MQFNQRFESSIVSGFGAPLLQGELIDQTDIFPLELAETTAVSSGGDTLIGKATALELNEILADDVSSLKADLKTSNRELQGRVDDLTRELSNSRAERQQELAEKESLAHRLTALLDALPGGVLVLDQRHTIKLANPVAIDLLGEPLLNMDFLSVIGECAASVSRDGSQVLLRSGRRISISNQLQDGYGDQVVLITDVTETFEAQQERSRTERLSALGEMIARLAHQIRTPLASSLLYLGAVDRPSLDGKGRAEITGKIRGRLQHMESLINDSLQFVKGGEIDVSECSLFDLMNALEISMEPVLKTSGASWSQTRPECDVVIAGNQDALLSALVAIAENAVQIAGPEQVHVHAEYSAEGLCIAIEDNGPGIDPALLERIFDPYYTTRPGGTGLGLALCAMIARNHDAALVAENHVGGARFILTLPRERLQRSSAGPQLQTSAPALQS